MKTTPHRPATNPLRRLHPLPALALLLASAATGVASEDEPPEGTRIDQTRSALSEWVETRRIIAQEEKDWRLAEELLRSRIETTRREIAERRRLIAEAEDGVTATDRKRQELLERNEELKLETESLRAIISDLEARTLALLERLPVPILDRVRPVSSQIPEDPEKTRLDLGRRYLNVIGVLNEVDKFNREISEFKENRERPDGSIVEVSTVYLGLGQAFYVDRTGLAAGVGRPGPDGWVWLELEGIAPAVQGLLAVLRNETPASYIELPIVVD